VNGAFPANDATRRATPPVPSLLKGLLCGFTALAAICGGPANSVALDSTWTSTWAGNAGGRI